MGVEPKIRGNPKMDGENNGKPNPIKQMGWFGGTKNHPYFWVDTHIWDIPWFLKFDPQIVTTIDFKV